LIEEQQQVQSSTGTGTAYIDTIGIYPVYYANDVVNRNNINQSIQGKKLGFKKTN